MLRSGFLRKETGLCIEDTTGAEGNLQLSFKNTSNT